MGKDDRPAGTVGKDKVGIVVSWSTKNSYGFVEDTTKAQYFIHKSSLPDMCEVLHIGGKMKFDSTENVNHPGKLEAVNIRLMTGLMGIIDNWNTERGFGFIEVPGHENYFLHSRNLPSNVPFLHKGTPVQFDLEPDEKKPDKFKAVNAVPLPPGPGMAPPHTLPPMPLSPGPEEHFPYDDLPPPVYDDLPEMRRGYDRGYDSVEREREREYREERYERAPARYEERERRAPPRSAYRRERAPAPGGYGSQRSEPPRASRFAPVRERASRPPPPMRGTPRYAARQRAQTSRPAQRQWSTGARDFYDPSRDAARGARARGLSQKRPGRSSFSQPMFSRPSNDCW